MAHSPNFQNSTLLSIQGMEDSYNSAAMKVTAPSFVLQKVSEGALPSLPVLQVTNPVPLEEVGIRLPPKTPSILKVGGVQGSVHGGVQGSPQLKVPQDALVRQVLSTDSTGVMPLPPLTAEPLKSDQILDLQKKSFLKNNYAYKMLLFLVAFGVCLYLTKKYWWKYLVQKFFPPDVRRGDLNHMLDHEKFSVHLSPYVKDLKESDVSEVLGPSPYVKIVMIYANWCKHCEVMMPAFEEAAKLMNESQSTKPPQDVKVAFMRAEAVSVPSLANRPSVPGFPTIVGIFQNGKEFPYMGPRTVDSLLSFAELIASTKDTLEGEVLPSTAEKPRKVNLQTLLANSSQQLPLLPSSPLQDVSGELVGEEVQETKIDSSLEEGSKNEQVEEDDQGGGEENEEEKEEKQQEKHQEKHMEKLEEKLEDDQDKKLKDKPLRDELSLRDKKDSESSKKMPRKKNLKL
jgi:thiol-disulfide isomerase/thioredoxin